MHPVITEICCCFCIKNDDDLQSTKLQSVVLLQILMLLHCLLVMVSDLELKSYRLESCKIIYSLIDNNSKFKMDTIFIIIMCIQEYICSPLYLLLLEMNHNWKDLVGQQQPEWLFSSWFLLLSKNVKFSYQTHFSLASNVNMFFTSTCTPKCISRCTLINKKADNIL